MDQEPVFDRALALIYESALVPERMPDALAAMTELLDGDTCHLVGWDRRSGIPLLSVSTGLPDEVGPDYAAHYAQIDPRRQLALTQAPGQLLNCHEHFDDRFVGRNEFFQDYLLPQVGVHYLLGSGDLVEESEQMILIGFQRYNGHGAFQNHESRCLERLLPHLRRSLRLTMRYQALREENECGETLLEVSGLATLALSSSGQVVWANQRGTALLKTGNWFHETQGRLRASNPERDAALQAGIRDVLANARPSNVNLGNGGGPEHCCATLIALPEANAIRLPTNRAALLAVVTTNNGQRIATVQQLMDFFRLSPAEARVVRALSHGESIEQYAQYEGVKTTTVKTQLQAAMAKTGTRSQKDLIRLVVTLPAVRG
jgi:DNA-binding CsgD family transcriptional regulator